MVVQHAVTADSRYGAGMMPTPFVVVGMVRGHTEAAAVPTPAAALDRMVEWLQEDDDASALWYLREDWPEPITVVGRLTPGSAGETRRTAHLFPIRPAIVQYSSLVAYCGLELSLPEIEWLNPGAGMPCERCLSLVELPASPPPPARLRR